MLPWLFSSLANLTNFRDDLVTDDSSTNHCCTNFLIWCASVETFEVAAEFGHIMVVEVLLQHNAHIDAQNAKGFSALMLSARNGHSAVVQLLCHQSALNLQDTKGRMALHHAAMRGHEDVVTCLLKASADVDSVDAAGRTPLHLSTLGLIETKQHQILFKAACFFCKMTVRFRPLFSW